MHAARAHWISMKLFFEAPKRVFEAKLSSVQLSAAQQLSAMEDAPRIFPSARDGDWLKRELPVLHKDFYLKHPDPSLPPGESNPIQSYSSY